MYKDLVYLKIASESSLPPEKQKQSKTKKKRKIMPPHQIYILDSYFEVCSTLTLISYSPDLQSRHFRHRATHHGHYNNKDNSEILNLKLKTLKFNNICTSIKFVKVQRIGFS